MIAALMSLFVSTSFTTDSRSFITCWFKAFNLSGRLIVTGEATQTIDLKVWPIPATEFWVEMKGASDDLLQVLDATGRIIQQKTLSEGVAVKVSQLKAGTYFLQLRKGGIVQKVIVQ